MFDLLIAGGTVADMATGELRAADVGIVGPLIASVLSTVWIVVMNASS